MNMNTRCCICITTLDDYQPFYNLKDSKSIHSKIYLISILENIIGESILDFTKATVNLDICIKCYGLLNEVDQFKVKLLETSNKLKQLINNTKEQELSNSVTKTLVPLKISSTQHYIFFENENKKSKFIDSYENDQRQNCIKITKFDKEILPKSDCNNLNIDVPKRTDFVTNGSQRPIKKHNFKCFICEICGQSYKNKSTFNLHMKNHKGMTSFSCTFCNKSFTQKISLIRHLPLHTGDQPHQCDECGKRFVHHTSFKVHKLMHAGKKNFKCEFCGQCFRSSSHLKRHSKIHTNEKKFGCTVCDRKFAERYNLAAHQKVHIGKINT